MIVICTRYTRQLSEIVNLEANRDLAQVAHTTMLSLRVGVCVWRLIVAQKQVLQYVMYWVRHRIGRQD